MIVDSCPCGCASFVKIKPWHITCAKCRIDYDVRKIDSGEISLPKMEEPDDDKPRSASEIMKKAGIPNVLEGRKIHIRTNV